MAWWQVTVGLTEQESLVLPTKTAMAASTSVPASQSAAARQPLARSVALTMTPQVAAQLAWVEGLAVRPEVSPLAQAEKRRC